MVHTVSDWGGCDAGWGGCDAGWGGCDAGWGGCSRGGCSSADQWRGGSRCHICRMNGAPLLHDGPETADAGGDHV